jgi:hypothetical protein
MMVYSYFIDSTVKSWLPPTEKALPVMETCFATFPTTVFGRELNGLLGISTYTLSVPVSRRPAGSTFLMHFMAQSRWASPLAPLTA